MTTQHTPKRQAPSRALARDDVALDRLAATRRGLVAGRGRVDLGADGGPGAHLNQLRNRKSRLSE
jgi:hypothetical protein